MSIILPDGLPALWALKAEGLKAVSARDAAGGARDPLRVLLVNLMPDKPATERQIARLLAGTPHPVELALAIPDGYRPKTADPAHIWAFYKPWSRVRDEDFDGLVVTGAPVETLAFEDVTYWPELTEIFDWAEETVSRSVYICWAAQAALRHFHGVPKRRLAKKLSGVFRHRVHAQRHPLLRGFGADFAVPVSRQAIVGQASSPSARSSAGGGGSLGGSPPRSQSSQGSPVSGESCSRASPAGRAGRRAHSSTMLRIMPSRPMRRPSSGLKMRATPRAWSASTSSGTMVPPPPP